MTLPLDEMINLMVTRSDNPEQIRAIWDKIYHEFYDAYEKGKLYYGQKVTTEDYEMMDKVCIRIGIDE